VDNSGKYPTSFGNLIAANGGVYLKVAPPDPAGGAYTLTVPAVGPCTMTQPNTYIIKDGGNHDTTTTQSLPSAVAGTKAIAYCSGSGIIAN
jgi:secreted protein with Ig-like and vWFA domain